MPDIQISEETQAALREIMRLNGMSTIGDALRKTVGTELVLARHKANGWSPAIQRGNVCRELG